MHFIRDIVLRGKVKVVKFHIDDNPAYIMTKAVTLVKFERSLNLIGVTSYQRR